VWMNASALAPSEGRCQSGVRAGGYGGDAQEDCCTAQEDGEAAPPVHRIWEDETMTLNANFT